MRLQREILEKRRRGKGRISQGEREGGREGGCAEGGGERREAVRSMIAGVRVRCNGCPLRSFVLTRGVFVLTRGGFFRASGVFVPTRGGVRKS